MNPRPPFITRAGIAAIALTGLLLVAGCSGGGVAPSSGEQAVPHDHSSGDVHDEGHNDDGHILEESSATKVQIRTERPSADDDPGGGLPMTDVDDGSAPETGELDPANVIAAALVIAAGGDIEQAIIEGQFTVDEVEAAAEAIETDSLGDYVG